MESSALFKPYDETGEKCTLQKTGSGVYVIYEKNFLFGLDRVYVGHSKSDVKKTMYRHFQAWEDKSQIRVVYSNRSNYVCRVIFCEPERAEILEEALILKHEPRDNETKLKLFTAQERAEMIKAAKKAVTKAEEETPF